MPSQFDTVLLEMDVDDAQRTVNALRYRAGVRGMDAEPECDVIADYITVQIDGARRLAAQRKPAHVYMGFDRANDVTCYDPVAEAEARQS